MTSRVVLHVSGDFPDPINVNKTKVIASLLELTDAHFAHRVLSLNRNAISPAEALLDLASMLSRPICRTTWQDIRPFSERGEAVAYRAPSKGLLHITYLDSLAVQLAERLATDPPALIVGHKLTIEGVIVAKVAARLGIPYAITIQGDTDTKIMKARPDLRHFFARVYHEAAHVFCFAPWALAECERKLGRRSDVVRLLPCPTELDEPRPPQLGNGELISVFHLQSQRRKNLRGMVNAVARLHSGGLPIRLAIHGGGNRKDVAAAESIVSQVPGIRLAGQASRGELQMLFNRATGFVLPSLRETFGLVFIEALFAGLPIIYPQGQAISGYLDGLPFAIGVPARDTFAIAAAIHQLVEQEAPLKASLAEWQVSDDAQRFRRPAIAENFACGLRAAMSLHEQAVFSPTNM